MPSRKLFEYRKKIFASDWQSITSTCSQLLFCQSWVTARSAIRRVRFENLLSGAFKCLWETSASSASGKKTAPPILHIIIASSSRFPHFEHQGLSNTVLSGIVHHWYSDYLWMWTVMYLQFQTCFKSQQVDYHTVLTQSKINSCLEGRKHILKTLRYALGNGCNCKVNTS